MIAAPTANTIFSLRADNGQVLVTSKTYTTKQSAQNGIRAVQEIAASSPAIHMTS
ncbi:MULTISPECIES: YegP family protein [unclassified Mycobacterium]|uniref:YegP family protein n=1 Tax=unclassified Mycobacterium TaxID=2642494 RepID=UPI0009ED8614